MKNKILFIIIFALLFGSSVPVHAQTSELPVYIVQPGDTLYSIALQFNVTMDDLLAVNSIANENWLTEGDQIKIPGYEGISGQFIPYAVSLTDTYDSILQHFSIDKTNFDTINHLTSPNEIIAGNEVILPILSSNPDKAVDVEAITNSPEPKSGLALSAFTDDASFWIGDYDQLASAVLSEQTTSISDLSIDPYPIQQGKASVIRFTADPGQQLQFFIDNKANPLFEYEPGSYIGFYAINALAQVGLQDAAIEQIGDANPIVLFSQNLLTEKTAYPTDPVIIVEPELIDPSNTQPEENELFELASHVTDKDLWDGSFSYPIDDPCIRSPYGSIRSYNNGPYDAFHTGVDFGPCADNTNIYAAGSGRVVFAGEWFVRGNAVVIDHGWGIFTGYWHQSSLAVKVGDIVQEGQVIGTMGTTGRSTGYHLHWEVMVNDVQVDPLQWLDMSVP